IPSFYFFFFQAEDGIRDFHVTGVQTCALPISTSRSPSWARWRMPATTDIALTAGAVPRWRGLVMLLAIATGVLLLWQADPNAPEIGRASCREKCRCRWVAIASYEI